jgi:hypothetical protein
LTQQPRDYLKAALGVNADTQKNSCERSSDELRFPRKCKRSAAARRPL